nr:MAG TPA: hypothetical protein [Caudoviricetes sp.]
MQRHGPVSRRKARAWRGPALRCNGYASQREAEQWHSMVARRKALRGNGKDSSELQSVDSTESFYKRSVTL